jgi:hypothetical protein
MSQSRRNFIQSAALTVLGSAAFPAFSQSAESKTFNQENLILLDGASQQTFEPFIGSVFSVYSEDKAMGSMKLVAVTELTPAKKPNGMTSSPTVNGFALRFRGTGASLPQGVYTLKNGAMGGISLLLVPSGMAGSPTTYSAVFAHLE